MAVKRKHSVKEVARMLAMSGQGIGPDKDTIMVVADPKLARQASAMLHDFDRLMHLDALLEHGGGTDENLRGLLRAQAAILNRYGYNGQEAKR